MFIINDSVFSQNLIVALRTESILVEDQKGTLKTCHKDSNTECPINEQSRFSPYVKFETSPLYLFNSNFALDFGITSTAKYSVKIFDLPNENETTLIEYNKNYGFEFGLAYYIKFFDKSFFRLGLALDNSPIEVNVNGKRVKGEDKLGLGFKYDLNLGDLILQYREYDRVDFRTEQKNNDDQEPVLDFTERFIIVGYNIYPFFEKILK